MSALEREREVFSSNVELWKIERAGKFVVIHGAEVLGFFESLDSAFTAGVESFGSEYFLVKQILPDEMVNVSFMGRSLVSAG